MPHGLQQVLLIVDDLLLEVGRQGADAGAPIRALELRVGDEVVRRRDGARFTVLGFTMEGTGVELQGIDQPITIILLKDDVRLEFDPAGGDDRR